MSAGGGRPDIEFAAAASGRELRFRSPPRVALRADEVASLRAGLPRSVRAGVTYGRFAASTRLASRLRVVIGPSDRPRQPPCRGAGNAP